MTFFVENANKIDNSVMLFKYVAKFFFWIGLFAEGCDVIYWVKACFKAGLPRNKRNFVVIMESGYKVFTNKAVAANDCYFHGLPQWLFAENDSLGSF